jgi:hypothetical protein
VLAQAAPKLWLCGRRRGNSSCHGLLNMVLVLTLSVPAAVAPCRWQAGDAVLCPRLPTGVFVVRTFMTPSAFVCMHLCNAPAGSRQLTQYNEQAANFTYVQPLTRHAGKPHSSRILESTRSTCNSHALTLAWRQLCLLPLLLPPHVVCCRG